jgi:hypothetical protein
MPHDSTARAASRGAKPGSMYRLLRAGAAQIYRTARDQGLGAARSQLAGQSRAWGNSASLPAAVVAGRAAFLEGDDETVERVLADVTKRFPYAAPAHELKADLLAFRGDYPAALREASRARLVEPTRPAAVSRVVRMAYGAGASEADSIAVRAVRLMPLNSAVLWAAAKGCSGAEQYERLYTTWSQSVPGRRRLPDAVRPLAAAAARAGKAELASDLYREAIAALHTWPGTHKGVPAKELRGKGAWGAVQDLLDILDAAKVPFFFAAGTALGLIREGRPLDLDGDIDVGVFESDWDRDVLVETFRKDPRFDLEPNPMSRKIALKHRAGSPVDIFPFYEEDGRVWHDGLFVRWWNSPFSVERREIRGLRVPLPEDHDRYLTENYGDWQTPNPGYDVFTEAPNYQLRRPEYGHMHLLRRAFTSLSGDDRDAATSDLKAADEIDLVQLLEGTGPGIVFTDAPGAAHEAPVADSVARTVDEIILHARELASAGHRDKAISELDAAIRDRRWTEPDLWAELAAHVEGLADYQVIRQLWFDGPHECGDSVPIMRAVGWSATAAADHNSAQVLLGKAIQVASRTARRPNSPIRRAAVNVASMLDVLGSEPRPGGLADRSDGSSEGELTVQDGATTALLLGLLDSIIDKRVDDVQRYAALIGNREVPAE